MIRPPPRLAAVVGLGLITALAAAIRLAAFAAHPDTRNHGLGQYGDSRLYHIIGYNLYRGRGFSGLDNGDAFGAPSHESVAEYKPAAVRGPVYPAFIAAVYRLFGDRAATDSPSGWRVNWNRVRAAQCVADAGVCLAVFFMARRFARGSPGPALLAAALYALDLYAIYYSRALLSETVAALILAGSMAILIAALDERRMWLFGLAGAGFGAMALCKSEYLLWIPLAAATPLLMGDRFVAAVRRALVLASAAVLIILPWSLRNWAAFGRPIPVATGSVGYLLYLGTFEGREGWVGWDVRPDHLYADATERAEADAQYDALDRFQKAGLIEVEGPDAYFAARAVERIRGHPLSCAGSWLLNVPRLWYQNNVRMYEAREPAGGWALGFILLAAVAFLLADPRAKRLMLPVWLLAGWLTAVFLPMHIEARYSVPVMPSLIALAGIGLGRGFRAVFRAGCAQSRAKEEREESEEARRMGPSGPRVIRLILTLLRPIRSPLTTRCRASGSNHPARVPGRHR